jgi:osmotically-inducible protein OsmY
MDSDIDGGIEKNYKAALIANHLDKQHVDFSAKNGVLTLKGRTETAQQRQRAQIAAANVPNVKQVLNQIEVRR